MDYKKILIVDDNLENINTITSFMDSFGQPCKLMQALNSEMAMNIAREERPDLIITDWDMPNMDGIELIKQLQLDTKTKKALIIVCTGAMTTAENLKTALEAGAIDYIRKPVDKIELISRIRSVLLLGDSYNELKKKNKELKNLNATKDKFFSIISHDLRSPLNSLLGLSELLKDNINAFEQETIVEFSNSIYDASSNILNLLDNLLEWSKLQIGRIDYNPSGFDLNEIVEENILLLKQNADAKNIVLISNITEKIPVYVDKYMISTVIRNLISNAIKFTQKKGRVSVNFKKIDSTVEIMISDNGVGITKENIKKLFSLSKSFSTKGTENEKGTGLGLLLCEEFLESHNSKLKVDSEKNKGSTFSFVLPLGYLNAVSKTKH